VTASYDPDREVLAAALRGEGAATDALTRLAADIAWTACQRVTPGGKDAGDAFRNVMSALRASGFARLKGFDGRARVRIYVELIVRDLLSERVIKLLATDLDRGWKAFEAFFADDIRRMLLRILPGATNQQNREDGYQSVCEALLKNNLQRLRTYSGRGSPCGFILHVVENLVIDFVRTIVPRRRLPAAVQRLSALDQAIFKLLYWERVEPSPAALAGYLSRLGDDPPTTSAIAEAIDRVRAMLPTGYILNARGQNQTVHISAADEVALASGAEDFAVPTPEDKVIDGERAVRLEQALVVLQAALPKLEASERLYLQHALTGQPAREIARLLGQPVEDIHKLAQRVKRRLRDELGDAEAVKKWRLTV
jgi:RNA polymerase primary sigma factor